MFVRLQVCSSFYKYNNKRGREVQKHLQNLGMSPLFPLRHCSDSHSPFTGGKFAETYSTAPGVGYRTRDCGSTRVRGVSCYCLLVAVQKIPVSAGIMSLHRRRILFGVRILIVLISCGRFPNAAALPAERSLHSHSTCIASDPHHLHKGDSTKRRLNICLLNGAWPVTT